MLPELSPDTPLHITAKHFSAEQVIDQIEAGADVNRRCVITGKTGLHHAAGRGLAELVKAMLDAGADKTIRSKKGFTPHGEAVRAGHHNVADLLK